MPSAHTDAFVVVDGKVQPTAGNRAVEVPHIRTVISRYGGVIRQAAAVAIPPQTKGGYSRALHVTRSTQPQDGKGHGDNSNRDRAGGWLVGYSGHRPGARDIHNTMACGGVPLFHSTNGPRPILGQGVALADRPTTSWQEIAPAHKPTPKGAAVVGGVGIPGYAGHVPHGVPLDELGRPMRPASAPSISVRAPEYKALDRSGMPKMMPLVGYTGHLRRTKESNVCFGTSHWRPQAPPSRAAQAALAYERARQKAIEARRPNDFKDNDPFAGFMSETNEQRGTWKDLSA